MAARVLVDSGFWFALWDKEDQWHGQARAVAPSLSYYQLILPWPTLYETLCTRFVRRRLGAEQFIARLEQENHHKVDDQNYRDAALAEAGFALMQGRSLSLVDAVLRQMLRDETLQLKGMVTFNVRDFEDVVYSRGIAFYPDPASGS